MAEDTRFQIAHKDGRQYAVTKKDFTAIYAPEGFKIVANSDGTAYEGDQPKAAKPKDTKADAS